MTLSVYVQEIVIILYTLEVEKIAAKTAFVMNDSLMSMAIKIKPMQCIVKWGILKQAVNSNIWEQ